MRILFITHYTKLYGANLSLVALVSRLAPPMEPHVLCPSGGELVDLLRGRGIPCHIRTFGISFTPNKPSYRKCIWRFRYLPRMVRLVRRIRPGVLYTNTSVIDYGAWLGLLSGRPHVWHFREFGEQDYGIHYDGGPRIYRFLLRKAAALVAVSRSIQEKVLPGIPSHLVYNGVAPEAEIRPEHRQLNRPPRFAIIGHLHPSKGQDTAIRVYSQYVAKKGAGNLSIVGSGEESYETTLRDMVEKAGMNGRIEFTGYRPDMDRVYGDTDILLMCSSHEAFGRVTAEAMAHGIPVIGYDAGGTSEIVSHGENGWLYRDEEGLLRAMFDLTSPEGPYEKMSRNAIEAVRTRFTIEQYTAALTGIIQGAAGKRRK